MPYVALRPVGSKASSTVFVLPSTTPPDCLISLTDVASSFGTNAASSALPDVVIEFFSQKISLIPNGTPCNGPRDLPDASKESAFLASSMACSVVRVMKAPIEDSYSSACVINALTTSSEENAFFTMPFAISELEASMMEFITPPLWHARWVFPLHQFAVTLLSFAALVLLQA